MRRVLINFVHGSMGEEKENIGRKHTWVKCTKMKGVEHSYYESAFEHYKQAADLGDAQAQYALGIMYYKGEVVVRDIAKTKEWWTKAAAQGEKNAIKNLKLIINCS